MKDYLAAFLSEHLPKKLESLQAGNPQNPQKVGLNIGALIAKQPSKPSKPTFEGFEGSTSNSTPTIQPDAEENIEMHDSALFDVVVEVDFYDGRRIRIPQQSTPNGWEAAF